ncbi:UNVERIFIED_CONTAM: hypothetical protein NCL1_34998 [Trichonephila clavipes]
MDRIRFSVIRTITYPNGVRSSLIRINDVLLYLPFLVSVQSARRFLLSASRTHRQHYDPKLRYPPKKKPNPRLFRSISFVIFPFLPFFQPFKTSGAVHSSPLTLSHWWAYVSRSAASEAISYTVVWPDYCLSSLTGTKVQTLNKR